MPLAISGIDLTVLVVYLAAVVAFGLWVGRGQRDAADYFLGGRDLPWWAILLSIVATETSTATFLSIPGSSYNPNGGNLAYLQLAIGLVIGRFAVAGLLLPQFFRGQLFTAYEVLDRRFGGATKQAASLLFLLTRNLGDGLRLFLAAIVLATWTGWDMIAAVLVIGAATILYTLVGGMRSVVWNDCVQFIVYIAGAVVALCVIASWLPGGLREVVDFGRETGRLRVFDFSWGWTGKSITLFNGLVGGVFLALCTHGVDQLMVQRYLAARCERDARRALVTSGFIVFAQFALFLFIGVALACFYDAHPPEKAFSSNDEVFATFIVERMGRGVVGLMLAAVFSAVMSTLSSSLNSSATALVNDFWLPALVNSPTPRRTLAVSRAATLAFGAVQIAVAIGAHLASVERSVVDLVLAIASFTTGFVLGLFFLGSLTTRVSQRSALVGLCGGLALTSYVALGTNAAWPWYTVIGSSSTFVLGLTASWFVDPPCAAPRQQPAAELPR